MAGGAVGEDSLAGRVLGHYRIVEKIGAGGMGEVYRALDEHLKREVAIKVLPPGALRDDSARQRFRKEALSLSGLGHPNIATVHDFDTCDGLDYLVEELIPGMSLDHLLANGALSENEFIDLGVQLCAGLAAAHAHGVIHRDIKPGNLRVTPEGHLKIIDFGLAKSFAVGDKASNAETASVTQTVSGTLPYMSPEQLRNARLDPRTDIWAAGCVLYEMATRRRPFSGSGATLTDNILHGSPAPPTRTNHKLSPAFDAIVQKCLEKDPALRYQSAQEIAVDLKRMTTPSSAAVLLPKKRRLWIPASAGFLVLAAVLLALFWHAHRTTALTAKDTVVVADFDNKTGDPVFDDALKTGLTIALNQSPFLNALSDNKVAETLTLMTLPPATRLTPDITRELCQRAASKAYIAGAITSLGSEYVVGLKAVNCRSGDTLAQEQVTATSKEKVLNSVGDAAAKLRRQLGESLATVQKFDVPLEQATTKSLEALQAYSLGEKTYRSKGAQSALAYHQRAVQLDPEFATGYVSLALTYSNLGELDRASEYFTKAYESRSHASERERLLVAAGYYTYVTGELERAVQTYQEIVASYPRDAAAYLNLAIAYGAEGRYELAVEATRQSLAIAPENVALYEDMANFMLALQRFDDARNMTQQAQARSLDDLVLRNALYAIAFLAHDRAGMAEQEKWYTNNAKVQNDGLALASDTLAYEGRLANAQELTKLAADSAIQNDSDEMAAIEWENSAVRLAAFGSTSEARLAVANGLTLASASRAVAVEAALAYAMTGDLARAQTLADGLNKKYPLDTQVQSIWLPAIHAQVALTRKLPTDAIRQVQRVFPLIEYGQIEFINQISCLYPTYTRGQAYLAAGQGREAAAEFQKILDHSGIVWNCWTGALARLGLARANAMQAKNAQGADAARLRARAAYKDFLTLWKDADPDVPIYKQAKAEYAKLQ